jgi:methylmalonyl-CoA/ethylmalonyl-CoA epimerase
VIDNTGVNSTFSKFKHVSIVVRDLDKAIERLESLGIGPFKAVNVPPFKGAPLFRGKSYHARVKGVVAWTGEVAVELLQPIEGESTWKEFLDKKGGSIHHISFHVDDLDKEIERLTKQGCSVLLLTRWEGGGQAYIDTGLDGFIIEIETGPLVY